MTKSTRAARNNVETTYTDARGRFAKGNPGRPLGARHRITRAIEEMLEDQSEAITQKAVDMALAGDRAALRLCMERIAPPRKDVPMKFDLPPMKCANDAAEAAQAVLQAVSGAEITPLEAASILALIERYRGVLESSEIERRIDALERATKE